MVTESQKMFRPLLLTAFALGGLFVSLAFASMSLAIIDVNVQVSQLRSEVNSAEAERTIAQKKLEKVSALQEKEAIRKAIVAYQKAKDEKDSGDYTVTSVEVVGDTAYFVGVQTLTESDVFGGFARITDTGWQILTLGTSGVQTTEQFEELKIPLQLRY